ncbi:hypothetical protein FF1_001986 [Malus domestica]
MQSFGYESLNFFLNLPLLGQWNFRLPSIVTYRSRPLFPMLDSSMSRLRCLWHVPGRRTSRSQATDVRWRMLLTSLVVNEHFAWKVVHVDNQSVTLTVNVCSSVGLIGNARSFMH